jgi:uncharacterized membrane protein
MMQFVLIKWIHLVATIAWLGAMFTQFFILMPVITRQLDPPAVGKLIGAVMRRTRVVVYVAISLFILSGTLMVSMHQKVEGRISVGDNWFLYLFAKLFLFLVMVIMAVVAFEVLSPRAARLAKEGPSEKLLRLGKTQRAMAMTGFILGLLILALSASL